METNELKFLLKLVGCNNYRTQLAGKEFKSFKDKQKICLALGDRELVDYSREIISVKILPPGRALLKMPSSQIPMSATELTVLEAIGKAKGKVKPIQIKIVKGDEREEVLRKLRDKGLIDAESKLKRTKAEVWLTQRGIDYLRDDYNAKGNSTITLELLNNYLRFLRKFIDPKPPKPSDKEVLQIILKLDKELGTENYLPIFHLRQKLQPPLDREELNQAIFRLQRDDKIELSGLVDATPYTPEQLEAGIPKDTGGWLFFIMVT